MSGRPKLWPWYLLSFLAVPVIMALALKDHAGRERCFTTCELSTIGREFCVERRKERFYLVHRCPEHGRTFLEPVPREVWFEMREQGVPEMRMKGGVE